VVRQIVEILGRNLLICWNPCNTRETAALNNKTLMAVLKIITILKISVKQMVFHCN